MSGDHDQARERERNGRKRRRVREGGRRKSPSQRERKKSGVSSAGYEILVHCGAAACGSVLSDALV